MMFVPNIRETSKGQENHSHTTTFDFDHIYNKSQRIKTPVVYSSDLLIKFALMFCFDGLNLNLAGEIRIETYKFYSTVRMVDFRLD